MSEVIMFIFLSYFISWGIWIPIGIYGNTPQWFLWVAGFGPTLAALIATLIEDGWHGIKGLFITMHKNP